MANVFAIHSAGEQIGAEHLFARRANWLSPPDLATTHAILAEEP